MRRSFRALQVVLALLAGACGGDDAPSLQIGLQRIALDLAFTSDEKKAEPRQVLVPTAIPSQAEFAVNVPAATFDGGALPPLPPPCPVAPEGAVPLQPATVTVNRAPVAGVYAVHRTGTFAIESAVFPFEGPMPPTGEKEYRNITATPGAPDAFGNPGPETYEYEVHEQVGDGYTTRSLRVTPSEIQLLQQVTKVGETTVTFTPTPPITLVALGTGLGDTWTSAGVDTATGTSMIVEGSIVALENVDVCGEVHNTFVVKSTERITNVREQYTSQTDDAALQPDGEEEEARPNTYWVATQYGGLFLQEELHTTTTLTTQVGDARVPITLKLDYTNTFDSIEPVAPERV